jgi:hypothetical protein
VIEPTHPVYTFDDKFGTHTLARVRLLFWVTKTALNLMQLYNFSFKQVKPLKDTEMPKLFNIVLLKLFEKCLEFRIDFNRFEIILKKAKMLNFTVNYE